MSAFGGEADIGLTIANSISCNRSLCSLGTECNSILETARVHDPARRRRGRVPKTMRVPPWRRAVAPTWPRPRSFPIIVLAATAILLAGSYITYRLVDPLPPRHFVIAAGIAESGYDNFAKRYARILARDGVDLEIRNTAGAVENLDLLRDPASKVQAALITLGFAHPGDADHLASLGGVFDADIRFLQERAAGHAIGSAARQAPCHRHGGNQRPPADP